MTSDNREAVAVGGYLGLAGVRTWTVEVTGVADITPRMRRVELTASDLDALEYLPGQDLMLIFPQAEGRPVHRRYTIRRFDVARRLLELNFVMHGDGPAARWAQVAEPGVRIEVAGPRGKITLAPDADWHLFAGDATGLPVSQAMMEAVPPGSSALAFISVDGPEEEQPAPGMSWLHADQEGGEAASALGRALAAAELPAGRGHAYLAGEVGLVTELKGILIERGLAGEQVSAKGYWKSGRANASHGEPESRVG